MKWFVGAKYNIVHDALDKQAEFRKNKVAYIWEGENGDVRKITYGELTEKLTSLQTHLRSSV